MNEKFEDQDALRQRLRQADPAANVETLNGAVVARAALSKSASSPAGWRSLRNFFSGAGVLTASVAVLALAVGLQQQPLIKLGTTNVGGGAEASSDRAMFYNPVTYEYVAGPGLSNQGGRGGVYQLELSGDPRERLAQLAARFGVVGDITRDEWSSAETPSFSISNDNKYLSIYWGGTGGWSFSSWSDSPGCVVEYDPGLVEDMEPSEGATPAEPKPDSSGSNSGSGTSSGGSEESPDKVDSERGFCDWVLEPTPELIPSNAEITRQALDLFAATGLDVSASDLRIYRDEWGASASASLRVDGQATAIEWYVGWNSVGEVSYAAGHSVVATYRGDFRTISPVAAVERLGDWRWYGSVASEIYERYYGGGLERGVVSSPTQSAPTEVDAGTTDSAQTDSSGEPEDLPTEEVAPAEEKPEPTADIMPVYPEGEMQVVTLTVDSSEPVLLTIYDAAGGAWLVPGYLMFNSEGYFDAVIALEDGVIELPEPIEYDILPLPADLGRDNMIDE
jgi:hypothetical protein